MSTDPSNEFQSVLSVCMEKFLREKHACGYAYRGPARMLRHLDKFLVQEGLATCELPGPIARKWLAKKAHESVQTQEQRIKIGRASCRERGKNSVVAVSLKKKEDTVNDRQHVV